MRLITEMLHSSFSFEWNTVSLWFWWWWVAKRFFKIRNQCHNLYKSFAQVHEMDLKTNNSLISHGNNIRFCIWLKYYFGRFSRNILCISVFRTISGMFIICWTKIDTCWQESWYEPILHENIVWKDRIKYHIIYNENMTPSNNKREWFNRLQDFTLDFTYSNDRFNNRFYVVLWLASCLREYKKYYWRKLD